MRLDDYDMPTDELTIKAGFDIKDSEMSASSSSTSSSLKGFSANTLNVSFVVSFDDEEIAQEVLALSRALEKDGSQKVYSIINKTAQVLGIQKVRFSGKVSCNELPDHKEGWTVSFILKEHDSVPERKEQKVLADVPAPSAPSPGVAGSAVESDATKPVLTDTEQVMDYLNSVIKQWAN